MSRCPLRQGDGILTLAAFQRIFFRQNVTSLHTPCFADSYLRANANKFNVLQVLTAKFSHGLDHLHDLAAAEAFRFAPLPRISRVKLPQISGARVIDEEVVTIGNSRKTPAIGDQWILLARLIGDFADLGSTHLVAVDISQIEQQSAGREITSFFHGLCASEISHIRITRAVDDRFRTYGGQTVFGPPHHSNDSIAFYDGIDRLSMDKVLTAQLVQSIKDRNLQIVDIAEELVLSDSDRLIPQRLKLLQDQLMHYRSRLTGRTHLIDRHSQGPSRDSTEKCMVFDQQRIGALLCGTQRRTDSSRSTANDQHIHGMTVQPRPLIYSR